MLRIGHMTAVQTATKSIIKTAEKLLTRSPPLFAFQVLILRKSILIPNRQIRSLKAAVNF